jgi:hypothetical protein
MLGILYERHGLLYESSEEYRQGVKEAQEQVRKEEAMKGKADMSMVNPSFKFYQLE